MPDGMRELVDILEAMVRMKGEVADQRELFKDVCERIVKRASAQFGVRQDEVGILVLTSDAQALRFVTPHKLAELGTLPLTKRESVAVGVFNRKVGEVNNKLVTVRHVHFFETVKIRERAEPIQKMVK